MKRLAITIGVAMALALSTGPVAAVAPSNDDVHSATVISTLPFTDHLDTRDATSDPSDSGCGGPDDLATVWYTFTPSQTLKMSASAAGSSYSTGVNLFSGTADNRVLLACAFTSVSWTAAPGTTYFLMAAACCEGVNGGDLVFTVTGVLPVKLGLSVNPTGTIVRKTGIATIGGMVTCNQPISVDISGELRQTSGGKSIHGSFDLTVPCTAPSATWAATIAGANGKFAVGSARVSALAFACNPADCGNANVGIYIQLRAP